MPNTLINVSNRLPVTVEEDRVTKSSGGLVAALEGLPEEQYKTKWIGWPGAAFPEESRRQEIARKLAEEHGCVAVFLSQEEVPAFYEGSPIPASGHCFITCPIICVTNLLGGNITRT